MWASLPDAQGNGFHSRCPGVLGSIYTYSLLLIFLPSPLNRPREEAVPLHPNRTPPQPAALDRRPEQRGEGETQ